MPKKPLIFAVATLFLAVGFLFGPAALAQETEAGDEPMLIAPANNVNSADDEEAVLVTTNANTSATATETIDPGLLPDSHLYTLKSWWEEVRLAFTFNSEKKVELLGKYAAKRLAEADALIAKGKDDLAEKQLERFANTIRRAEERVEKLGNDGKELGEVLQKMEQNRYEYQEMLQNMYGEMSETGQTKAIQAMEQSANGLQQVMERVQGAESANQFKAEVENRIQNSATNTALEVRERLRAKNFFGLSDSE